MKKEFEVRMYEDQDNPAEGYMMIEISKIKSCETLQRIINFLERIREC